MNETRRLLKLGEEFRQCSQARLEQIRPGLGEMDSTSLASRGGTSYNRPGLFFCLPTHERRSHGGNSNTRPETD